MLCKIVAWFRAVGNLVHNRNLPLYIDYWTGLNEMGMVKNVIPLVGWLVYSKKSYLPSVTRLGNLLDFGQLFKAFGNN